MFFNKDRKLRNFLIYPSFQLKLIGTILAIASISPICVFLLQYITFNYQLPQVAAENNLSTDHPYFAYLQEFHGISNLVLSFSVLLTFIVTVVVGMIISHRIAGPLIKMEHQLNDVADEKMSDAEIHFRKGDFFSELAEAYNRKFRAKK